ncbi:MAG: thiamine phosphate synthase [Deltaproteobacteria bacterium]|nr:thiamine phosphate synthase [Deltaproteobacteria bacterium]
MKDVHNNNNFFSSWSIAGFDPSCGSGTAADIKTFQALNVPLQCIATAWTFQNQNQCFSWEALSQEQIKLQIEALLESEFPRIIKIGMVGAQKTVELLGEFLSYSKKKVVIYDPVLCSSSGGWLIEKDAIQGIKEKILPHVDILTPNRNEVELFLGKKIPSEEDYEEAVQYFLNLGVKSVLLKGGHFESQMSCDLWSDGKEKFWLSVPRMKGASPRGTGCTFSSAIAAYLAQGHQMRDAIVLAKAYISQCIRLSTLASLNYSPWHKNLNDFPLLSKLFHEISKLYHFPDCGRQPLGFYPIVPRVHWLKKLLSLGVKTAQLRIKDLKGIDLEEEIKTAVQISKEYECRLFINDYWNLAIKYNAYGVHLGQEDLDAADIQAINKSSLRLGISSHSFYEVARARSINPSYIAYGPIYPTTCKSMKFGPQGVEKLGEIRQLIQSPLVAIGGLNLDRLPQVMACGVDGYAVISDVLDHAHPLQRCTDWLLACARPLC